MSKMKGQEAGYQRRLDDIKVTLERMKVLGNQYQRQVRDIQGLLERAQVTLEQTKVTLSGVVSIFQLCCSRPVPSLHMLNTALPLQQCPVSSASESSSLVFPTDFCLGFGGNTCCFPSSTHLPPPYSFPPPPAPASHFFQWIILYSHFQQSW